MPEYIGIKEFAERAGITPQAVYQRLSRGLANHAIKDEKGNWRISTEALKVEQEVEQEVVKHVEQGFNADLQSMLKALQGVYKDVEKTLQEQISDLQRQLADRDATIATKDAQIAELALRIATLAENAQQIQGFQLAQLSAAPAQEANAREAKDANNKFWSWFQKKKKL